MIVTDIQSQKKKGRYNLFVDGVFYSGIDAETLIKSGIKIGSKVEKNNLQEIVASSEIRSAFDRVINIISKGEHTKREIKTKLLKYGYNEASINDALSKAEEYGYVNDKQYAEMFSKAKGLKSKRDLKFSLYNKGVDKKIIDQVAENLSQEEELKRANILADKYMKNKEINSKNLANLYAYLYRKGFIIDNIKQIIKKYNFDDFEGDIL